MILRFKDCPFIIDHIEKLFVDSIKVKGIF